MTVSGFQQSVESAQRSLSCTGPSIHALLLMGIIWKISVSLSFPATKNVKVLKKFDRPKENKSTSAKLGSIKHCKFHQVRPVTKLTYGFSYPFLLFFLVLSCCKCIAVAVLPLH